MSGRTNSFVVVANRLPVDLETAADGTREWKASPGGLVTALSPVLEEHQGCWVGWPGVADEAPEPFTTDNGVLLHPVRLTQEDYEAFYEGFSNATLWPLYHDLIVTPVYNRDWWDAYREVNLRFANEVAAVAAENATVWVQDYQLQLVPGILRQLRPDLTIGFFLHIPFPSPDLFRQLPWREELVRGLLDANLIGFHLESNARNFLELARTQGLDVEGEVSTRAVTARIVTGSGHSVGVGAFPISIAAGEFADGGDAGDVAQLRAELGNPKHVILGVDRLDYTKGILQRLTAFEELLETFKDGMNLVAKEYVASHVDGTGALVLSEFAGAAAELTQANLCNPFDIESIKRALLSAVKALEESPETMRERMIAMNEQVRQHDIALWSQSFLGALNQEEA